MAHSPYQPLRKFANMSVTFDPQSIQATGKNSGVTIPVATNDTITDCRKDEIRAPPMPHTLKTSLPNEANAVRATNAF
jgi:hypothetical protein